MSVNRFFCYENDIYKDYRKQPDLSGCFFYGRRSEAKHCSSLCSQSEGGRILWRPNTAKNPTKSCAKALVIFATCSWPSLCEQSELQCWRRNRRLRGPARAESPTSLQPRATPWVPYPHSLRPVRAKVKANRSPILLPLQGVDVYALIPRALPWAVNWLPFQGDRGANITTFFATYPYPSLCEQSELQCWRPSHAPPKRFVNSL